MAAPEPPSARQTDGLLSRLIGVEEELLLVDEATLCPAPRAGEALSLAASAIPLAGTALELEVKREQLEAVSSPRASFDELVTAIADGRRAADEAARAVGARAVAIATTPVACQTHAVSSPRFDRMQERFGLTMLEQLTCGFHVHVTIASPDEGVAVLDRIRPWLPVLLALSANSPFWQGMDTGFASYRYQAWGRWPTAGPYDLFGTAERYRRVVDDIIETGVALDRGMIYFDARLSAHVPTVEVRIADVCLQPRDAAALAVLVRALVVTAVSEWRVGIPPDGMPSSLLRLASWQASRYGVEQDLLHPISGKPRPARDVVAALLEHVDAGFDSSVERDQVHRRLQVILSRGTGATQQRAASAAAGGAVEAIALAIAATHAAV
ncbi:glutamate--cysteine ligase [Microbacterium oryzae]|uniref:glutamate--cysteine ligase n=1 Tax=Microbacterium oryzae TaxID=743009 RepID=UPI0025B08934|nr:glutamate--cysteine ligase [Microbacterium oryzae]MDN3311145.1 glutamate--cysteine ligase [Microbacterium oryzae]